MKGTNDRLPPVLKSCSESPYLFTPRRAYVYSVPRRARRCGGILEESTADLNERRVEQEVVMRRAVGAVFDFVRRHGLRADALDLGVRRHLAQPAEVRDLERAERAVAGQMRRVARRDDLSDLQGAVVRREIVVLQDTLVGLGGVVRVNGQVLGPVHEWELVGPAPFVDDLDRLRNDISRFHHR